MAEERRWQRVREVLAAEAAGKTVRPVASQRTLFGIPSEVEQAVARIVAQDEEARRVERQARKRAEAAEGPGAPGAGAGEAAHVDHPLEPVFDSRSRVLVLGTIPSPASRRAGFYYGHPRNRFWRVLAELFDEPVADTVERRRDQVLRHHIALWDVLAGCTIRGAADASISDAVPNDLSRILDAAPIEAVFCTGAKAAQLYARLCEPSLGVPAVQLPSTSPANAAAGLDALADAYRALLAHLHEPAPVTLDVPRVLQLERDIAASGTPLSELMERAGRAIAHRVHARFPDARVAVLCGSGNNGGDGWVAARCLAERGHQVALVSPRPAAELRAQPARDAALAAEGALVAHGARIAVAPDGAQVAALLEGADAVVDAILGTGFAGDRVKAPYDLWIRVANERREAGAWTVAADCPSGLDAQSGSAAKPCIEADETVTMMVRKPAFDVQAAARFCGAVHVAPLAYLEGMLASL